MPSPRFDRIYKALEAIRKTHRGRLTRRHVVDAARSRRHPLHREFGNLWDDKVAADRARLERAGQLIRYVTVVVTNKPIKIVAPVYVHNPSAPLNVASYVALRGEDFSFEDAKAIMLAEVSRIESCVDRARGAASQLERTHPGIVAALEAALRRVVGLVARLEHHPNRHKRLGKRHEAHRISA